MTMSATAGGIALLSVGGLWGGMLFFAAVYAPLVFLRLEADTAGRFIRQVFPAYYLAMGVTSLVAASALLLVDRNAVVDAVTMLVVGGGFWFARQVLMPLVNRARDAQLAGDSAARTRFARLHRASVTINVVQLLASAAVLLRFMST